MEKVAPSVFVETTYPGVNVGAIVTKRGIICVDSPICPTDAQEWISRLHSTFGLPIRYLILTDYQCDRAIMASTFRTRVVTQQETQARLYEYGARIPAPVMESITTRYDLFRKELNGIPVIQPQISFCRQATILLGEHEITLWHMPSATPGSLWVFLKKERLLFTGDTVIVDQHPPLTEADSKGWLDALVYLRRERCKADIIIPGRGPLCEKSATAPISEYIRLARRRVYALYRAGRPRAETTNLIPEFIPAFPHAGVSGEWLHKQLKSGLDHIYDEYKAATLQRKKVEEKNDETNAIWQ